MGPTGLLPLVHEAAEAGILSGVVLASANTQQCHTPPCEQRPLYGAHMVHGAGPRSLLGAPGQILRWCMVGAGG